MGDLFLQRRAAAAASASASRPNATSDHQNQGTGGGQSGNALLEQKPKKSFADIQREQQQQQSQSQGQQRDHPTNQNQYQQRRHDTDDHGRLVRPSGSAGGGGFGGSGGSGGFGANNDPRGRSGGFGASHGGGSRNNDPREAGGYGSTNRTSNSSGSRSLAGDRRGDRSRGQRNTKPSMPAMPTEQGIIHTLLDKFGFITCADRERELFFHYSEFRGRSDELNIGDEVEFMVGRAEERGSGGSRRSDRGGDRGSGGLSSGGGGDEKWSAFAIKKLPEGTIIWENEDVPGKRYRGTVEAIARDESFSRRDNRGMSRDRGGGARGGGAVDGLVCIMTDENEAKSEETREDKIYYTCADYAKSSSLHRNDIVEFTLVTKRRTNKKYARDITLIQSERERLLEEREKKLMEDATLERGIVASISTSVGSNNSGRGGRSGGGANDTSYSGYLRSVNRTQDIYFSSSHVIIKNDTEEDKKTEGISTTDIRKSMLMEGQEVEFYVVNEAGSNSTSKQGGRGGGSGMSARQIKILPKGSVKFQHVIAKGVTGRVLECPVASVTDPPFGFGRAGGGGGGGGRKDNRGGSGKPSGNAGKKSQATNLGKIHLQQPILDDDQNSITEVSLRPENYPGGTFAISRTGSEMGTWIRPHDMLLFDVVQMVVDGACFAVPTLAMEPIIAAAESATVATVDSINPAVVDSCASAKDTGNAAKPAIRLIEPSPCMRAHGTIRSIHDNYGFIQLAERSGSGQSDAYFPLFEVMPGEIQEDLVRNAVLKDTDDNADPIIDEGSDKDGTENNAIQRKGGRIHVEVGMEVAFDLSLQMLTNTASADRGMGSARGDRSGGRYGNTKQEKESLRARRVQILPKGTVIEMIPIVSGVKATVAKDDSKRGQKQQLFVGTLELEESIKMDIDLNNRQRHPLVAKLVDAVSEGKYGDGGVTFHDVMSDRDAQVVISMVNGRDDLEWSYVVPESSDGAVVGDDRHARQLCIARKKKGTEEDEADNNPPAAVEVLSTSESINEASDEKEDTPDEEKVEGIVDTAAASASGAPAPAKGRQDSPRKKAKKVKIIKSVRFDKCSFPGMSIGPLGAGDVVTCDIFQSRRTGAYMVENITVLEKAAVVVSDGEDHGNRDGQRKGLSGFVTEVVPSRQFGFITGVDEQGSKTGEHVFFHFREVQSGGAVAGADNNNDIAQDGNPAPARSKKRNNDSITLRKGDEVKFDVGTGKNGKLNATSISVLPRGTLKLIPTNKAAADNTCTGYILMEPSHTSLANTPSHSVGLQSSGPAAGVGASRWANVRDDKSSKLGSSAKEEGVILLLSDPSHLFSSKLRVDSPPAKTVVDKAGEASPNENAVAQSTAGTAGSASEPNNDAVTDTENNNDAANDDNDQNQSNQSVSVAVVGTHIRYRLSSTAARTSGPKRGDLVSFGKTRGAKLVKDIRVETMGAATSVRGILEDIDVDNDTAVFVSSSSGEDANNVTKKYEVKLAEVVSCSKLLLKDKEQVDGILHDGKVFGVCRTKDIHLASSFGRNSSGSSGGLKERPKLNLTVKKELQGMGGKIMAQSRMATCPDGTNGFSPGWTKRVSVYNVVVNDEDDLASSLSRELSAAASEFVPNFSVAASGFETPVETEEDANDGD